MNEHTFPIRYFFPIQVLLKLLPNCLSHSNRACGWLLKFRSRGTTGSLILSHDFGHLCRGRRVQKSGHSDFGNFEQFCSILQFTCVQADTASAACPSQPGTLAITSIILAAVICDADEPCSVKTAQAPDSSFTMSPLNTALPLYFYSLGF